MVVSASLNSLVAQEELEEPLGENDDWDREEKSAH